MYKIDIFNEFELNDIIFDYISFDRNRMYKDAGNFTLILNTMEQAENLKRDHYVLFGDDCYVIENLHKFKSNKNELKFEITGRALSSILDRRCVADFILTTAEPYEIQLYHLINTHFISPVDLNRKIPFFTQTPIKGFIEKPKQEITFKNKNVLEIVKEICTLCDIGFKINFLPEEKSMQFELYQGRNMTQFIFFSEEFGNVAESELYEQGKDYKNVCYLNHDGIINEFGNATGLNRRETIITDNETVKAEEKLKDSRILISAECTILITEQFAYGIDWNLGDIVSFQDKSLGFEVEKPISEIKEYYSNVLDVDVVFGDSIPTIFDKLKKGGNNGN